MQKKSFDVRLPPYPVLELKEELLLSLEAGEIAVVDAPAGSGKSSLVPLLLLDAPWRKGRRIFLLQPRRAAVYALAARLRSLCGKADRVGYITRHEKSMPRDAEIIVMTEGIFVRKILEDPELLDSAAVILDEFHERSIHTDLSFVLALQARELFRHDLRLIVMSATLERSRFEAEGYRFLHAEGRLYPLSVSYAPPPAGRRIVEHAAAVSMDWIRSHREGNILLFLPGEGEIRRVEEQLRAYDPPGELDIRPLYGRLSPKEQQRAHAHG